MLLLTCVQISQESVKVVWFSHLFKNFPQFFVIHTVKGFGVVSKADVFLELSWFFYNPTDVGNLISGSSAFKLDSGSITIMKVKVKSHSVMSNSLQPHGLYNPWNSPGQNTGVGSLSLLQGIFSIQGYNTGLPHCRQILYQLSLKGSPRILEWSSLSIWYPLDLPNLGIEPGSPALQTDSLPTEISGKPYNYHIQVQK